MTDITAWLIERTDIEAGKTHYYFDLTKRQHGWTLDAHQARRFASKAEADAAIGNATGLRACEHVWISR